MFNDAFITQFHFIRPLWLLIFIPFALLIYFRWQRDTQDNQWVNKLPAHLSHALTLGAMNWQKQLPLKGLLVLLSLLVIIVAGPTWKKQDSPFAEDLAPLVIVLDVSESMLQQDVSPNRLQRAKFKIADLLVLRDGGKNALIVYAGSAHVAMPLTTDIDVFTPLLGAISPQIMPRSGKFAEQSLRLINQQLNSSELPGTVLLITDGLGLQTNARFKDYFSQNLHQLLVLGIGSEQADLPIEWSQLKKLASDTGGQAIQMSNDQNDVNWIVKRINNHQQLSLDGALPWLDMGYYLTFVVALLFLLWFRKGWLVQWCFIGAIFVSISFVVPTVQAASLHNSMFNFADIWLTQDQQGQYYFQQQDYLQAAKRFENPMWKGISYYFAGQYKQANNYFMRVDSAEGLFAAASTLARQREYIKTRQLLTRLLKTYPNHLEAQKNLLLVESIIAQIDQFSDSQGGQIEEQASKELGKNEPQTSEGSEEQVQAGNIIEEKLNAEQILQNDAVANKWMKRVQSNPAYFLSNKFSIQRYQQQESEQ